MPTMQEYREAIKLLRANQWPAILGPPPDAWNPDIPNREICNRTVIDIECKIASNGDPSPGVIES